MSVAPVILSLVSVALSPAGDIVSGFCRLCCKYSPFISGRRPGGYASVAAAITASSLAVVCYHSTAVYEMILDSVWQ